MAMAATGIMLWTTGCSSTAPHAATIKGDLNFTKEVSATITADQKFIIDGRKFKVADIPEQLAKRNVSKELDIIIYPESKMTRETLVAMVQLLVKNDYFVAINANSKYADVPVPRR